VRTVSISRSDSLSAYHSFLFSQASSDFSLAFADWRSMLVHLLRISAKGFHMYDNDSVDLDQISSIFNEEITAAGGTVHERFEDDSRLFIRSILPSTTEVQRGDKMKGGVALRAVDDEVWVHPYTYRLVCTNGAIHAHAVQTRHLVLSDQFSTTHALEGLREAIQMCCAPEAFASSAAEMREAANTEIDMLLTMAPMLQRMPAESATRLLSQLMTHFGTKRRGTRYDLTNAITATARTIRDPNAKWEAESLGAAVAAGKIVPARPHRSAKRSATSDETVGV
jgi:hypothetical protein